MPDPIIGAGADRVSAAPSSRSEPPVTRLANAGRTEVAAPSTVAAATNALTGALEGRKNAAADAVRGFAETVHRSGEQFKGQQDWIASAVHRGAAELDTLADTLREQKLGDLAGQVQGFATRQPILFLATTFAAGFGLARLGKIVAADLSRDDLPTIPPVGDAGTASSAGNPMMSKAGGSATQAGVGDGQR